MSPDENRRRLHALAQANPALRVISSPDIQTVGQDPDRRSNVSKAADVVASPFKPFAAGLANLFTNEAQKGYDEINQRNEEQTRILEQTNKAYKEGKVSREAVDKAISEFGTSLDANRQKIQQIGSTTDKSKLAASAAMTAAAPFALSVAPGASVATKVGVGAAEGAVLGGLDTATRVDNPGAKELATGAGIGGLFGGAVPIAGNVLSSVFKPALAKVKNVLPSNRVASQVAKSTSAEEIKALTGLNDDMANYLAQTSDPELVKNILKQVRGEATQAETAVANEVKQSVEKPVTRDDVVVEIYNPATGEKYFQRVKPEDYDEAVRLIDGNRVDAEGVAGKQFDGEVYHISAMSPEKAMKAGFKEAGEFNARDFAATTGQGNTLTRDFVRELRDTPAVKTAKDIVKDPRYSDLVAKSARSDMPDSLSTVMRMLANTNKKSEARAIVESLELGITNNQKNRIVNAITEDADPASVAQKIINEINADKNITAVADNLQGPKDLPAQTQQQVEAVQSAPQTMAGTSEPTPQTATVTDTPAPKATQTADDIAPNADPETKKAIQEVLDNLDSAESSYKSADKLRTKEKGKRIGAGSNAYETAGGGEAGFRAKLGQLKGKYSESNFNPITASQETQNTILDMIEKSDLKDFKKLNTQNAMRKIWGMSEGKPTPGDIKSIREFFGDEMADAVQQAVDEVGDGWKDKLTKLAGTPRALMSSFDFSFGGRQGAPLGSRFPKEWLKANEESAKYMFNKNYFDKAMKEIADSDYFETISDKMKVALTGADDAAEEAFMSADYAEAIPVIGKGVEGSGRAYTGGLTKLRYDVAKNVIDSYGGVEEFTKFFDGNEKALRDLGEVINTFTGRGGKAGGLVERHMKTLSTTLFAPRLWAAKLNMLNPQFYARLSPEARKLALQTSGTFATTAGTILSLAAAAGATVEWDPRSADFAKIKVGNTRYDILGGLQQNIRLGAQLITGEKINSITGEMATLGDGFTAPTRLDILYQAFENKENPLLAYATKILKGKGPDGEPINPLTEGIKTLIPLNIQSTYETSKDTGSLFKGALMNIPGTFGVGVQTYGSVPTKDQGTTADGKPMFKGKVTPEMVTDKDGNVLLDDKGKPVKIKIPEGASELEIEALKDDKRKAALNDTYRRNLSSEDKALLKLTDDQLDSYLEKGKIDEARYDQIQQYKLDMENIDGLPDVEGAKSDYAKNFYKTFNSMTKKNQEKYLSEADDNAIATAKFLNTERVEGLPEFKSSNKLAKLYADYEVDMNTKDYTEIDKQNRARKFQLEAMKLNYTQDQSDIYTEGGSADLKALYESGDVSKPDLDAAIELDNYLYNSGLTSSLKFSKKFRREYGYGVPSGKGGSGESASSGTKEKSQKAYLSQLFRPSGSTSSAKKPDFSTKTRNITFKSNVSTPTKSSKKVSIKL